MSQTTLFHSPSGPVTIDDLREALRHVGAHECSVLYVHTGLNFGRLGEGLTRRQVLDSLLSELRGLEVPTLCMPTFTFSFCNGEAYDRRFSRSRMGVLNEYFRSQPDAERSLDPLMSVAAIGQDLDLVRDLGEQSIGLDSTFDKLARRDDVRFLFLGVRLGACFTYMHYLEWLAQVPYRYDRSFSGEVIDGGVATQMTKKLFVRYNGVSASNASFDYEDGLAASGHLRVAALGSSTVSCLPRVEAEQRYLEILEADPNFFITEPFDSDRCDARFTPPVPMVAL